MEDLFLGSQWSIILGYRRLSVKFLFFFTHSLFLFLFLTGTTDSSFVGALFLSFPSPSHLFHVVIPFFPLQTSLSYISWIYNLNFPSVDVSLSLWESSVYLLCPRKKRIKLFFICSSYFLSNSL